MSRLRNSSNGPLRPRVPATGTCCRWRPRSGRRRIGRILDFPLPSLVRFCHNHGLLQIFDRPQWRTVIGGGRAYVGKLAGALADVRLRNAVSRIVRDERGVAVSSVTRASERFDAVVLACHSDQALALLGEPSAAERRLLSRVGYQRNRVVLHTDPRLLPRARAHGRRGTTSPPTTLRARGRSRCRT